MTERFNPYVGPRAFKYGETLYGRDREAQELLDLLIAERLVMLYSPSGAGKSSLLQASLIPELKRECFHVLPVIRVGLQRLGEGAPPPVNRYLFSVLLSLEEGAPTEQQRPVEELIGGDLASYLQRRGADLDDKADNQVLIFDQFEEVLTLDPTDRAAKTAFFQQLGAVLRDRRYWALFALREDYVGGLDPFLPLLPTRLKTTFRLDLLGEAAARDAIQRPARQAGIDFTAAAGKLVDDLREIRLQQTDGAIATQLGPWIEPVQLQVVCRRLWDRLPADAIAIEAEAVADVGTVNEALAGYYAEQVQAVAAATGVSERRIRDWCERQLITAQGLRGQVLRGADRSQGLDNAAIVGLVDAHLVRTEQRRGAAWCELAHDRLIGPVKQDNAAWREAHLSALQRQAALWEQQNHPDALALRDTALAEAEDWAAVHPEDLADHEHEFLARCQELREQAEREQRYYRRLRRLAAVLVALSLLATGAAVFAFYSYLDASEQTATAKAKSAENLLNTQPMDGLILAIEAVGLGSSWFDPEPPATVTASLRDALRRTRERNALRVHQGEIYAVAISPDGQLLASGGEDHTVRLWNVASGQPRGGPLQGHTDWIYALAFSPDGRLLASGGNDQTVRLWAAPDGQFLGQLRQLKGAVNKLDFSPDGQWLVAGGANGGVRLWEVKTGQPRELDGLKASVNGVAFSPDGKLVAAGDGNGEVHLWDAATGRSWGKPLLGEGGVVNAVAFNPVEHILASGHDDGGVRLWDVATGELRAQLTGRQARVLALAFSPNGQWLASSSVDRTIQLWESATGTPLGTPFRGHTSLVYALAFSPDGQLLISGGADGSVRLWDADVGQTLGRLLPPHSSEVGAVAFDPSSGILASGDAGGELRLLNVDTDEVEELPEAHSGTIYAMAFSPTGEILASGGDDGGVRLWDVSTWRPTELRDSTRRIYDLAFSADGLTLASGGDGPAVTLWDLATRQLPREFGEYPTGVNALALSPDGQWLACAGMAGGIDLWEVATGQRALPKFSGYANAVYALAFSPDGQWLASGSIEGDVRLWDPRTGQLQGVLKEQAGTIQAVKFSPDGQILAEAGDEGTVYLWEVKTRQLLGEYHGHRDRIDTLAFSADGRWLASGAGDRRVRLWPFEEWKNWLSKQSRSQGHDWQAWLRQACLRLRDHSRWDQPRTDTDRNARRTCETFFSEADLSGSATLPP